MSRQNNCTSAPCKNGAQCYQSSLLNYTCSCAAGFTGHQCERDIDDCERNNCAEGSICIDGHLRYDCVCPPGRSGIYCHKGDIHPVFWVFFAIAVMCFVIIMYIIHRSRHPVIGTGTFHKEQKKKKPRQRSLRDSSVMEHLKQVHEEALEEQQHRRASSTSVHSNASDVESEYAYRDSMRHKRQRQRSILSRLESFQHRVVATGRRWLDQFWERCKKSVSVTDTSDTAHTTRRQDSQHGKRVTAAHAGKTGGHTNKPPTPPKHRHSSNNNNNNYNKPHNKRARHSAERHHKTKARKTSLRKQRPS